MRFWFATILALTLALYSLAVAGSAAAADGCAGKAGQHCPCKQAPKGCALVCAAMSAEAGDVVAMLLPVTTPAAIVAVRFVTTARDGTTPGLDPPVPRR